MRKLFTFALALCCSALSFAQNSDSWKVGEEITDQIGWGNLSFENDPMDYWTLNYTKGSTTTTGGLVEVYDGENCDVFQVVYLPAGMYEVTCQGYYRWGTSWDEDPNNYGKDAWENNSALYASTGEYNIDSKEFTEARTFKTALMPRLFEEQYEQIYAADEETISAMGWDPSDGNYGQCDGKWAPTSVPGSLLWFQAGKYEPYDDEAGEKYNTVKFFLLEDGYVKLGVQKITAKSADSFMATNFKMYYQGEAGEAAQLAMALEELDNEIGRALLLSDEIRDAGYGSLASFLTDAIDVDCDESDLESIQDAVAQVKVIYAEYVEYYSKAKQLSSLIKSVESIIASTDYPGKSDLETALDAAVAVEQDGNTMDDPVLEEPTEYIDAFNALADARSKYIMGQDPVNGAINLSTLITTPFFCDAQYSPQWNEEANAYQFPSEELENTWATIQETAYSEVLSNNPEWIPIVNDFKLYDGTEVENQWYIKSTTWHGGGAIGVTMQHSYPALGGWTASPTGNPEIISQTITGLPNGFYSMSALMCNAGADLSELQYVFIQSGDKEEKALLSVKGNPWWGGNAASWRSGVWEKLTTGMIEVTDGKVKIGSSSDAFYAVTGFQLYYYGETPDFTSMIAPKLESVKALATEKLTWQGDIKNVETLLAQIPATIETNDAYIDAMAVIAEANAYINTAYNTINSFSAATDYLSLQAEEEENSDNYELYNPAIDYTLGLGEGEDDTYNDAVEATAMFNTYKEYVTLRKNAASFNTQALNDLLATQAAALKLAYATSDQLNEYMNELQAPINAAIFAQLGADNASETNPVDVTCLLVNPSFEYGPNYGWTHTDGIDATINEYGRGNAELWNKDPFDFYQIVRSLPAGAYQVNVRALYRDGGSVGDATSGPYYNWWYVAGQEMSEWANKNVVLYASNGTKEANDYIKSVCDGQFTEPSFTGYFNTFTGGSYTVGNNGAFLLYEDLTSEDSLDVTDPDNGEIYYDVTIDMENPAYPFDTKVVDGDDVFFYPSSMAGVYKRFQLSPEAYCNSVQIMVEDNGELRIGIRKDVAIGSDWVIFDDFQLLYLGTAVPSGIENVQNAEPVMQGALYNLAGQSVGADYRGIVICGGKKYLNK